MTRLVRDGSRGCGWRTARLVALVCLIGGWHPPAGAEEAEPLPDESTAPAAEAPATGDGTAVAPESAATGVAAAEETGNAAEDGAAVGAEPAPEVEPTLDLDALEDRLRGTGAIGFFTKLALKNEVDDLLAQVGRYHKGAGASGTRQSPEMERLRERYELLLLKVLTLLEDRDPDLFHDISVSREALWAVLADPVQFTRL